MPYKWNYQERMCMAHWRLWNSALHGHFSYKERQAIIKKLFWTYEAAGGQIEFDNLRKKLHEGEIISVKS